MGGFLRATLEELDEEGFLRITGRKKELIITSTGKNVAPALIENLLKEDPIISHAMAYGDGKSYRLRSSLSIKPRRKSMPIITRLSTATLPILFAGRRSLRASKR